MPKVSIIISNFNNAPFLAAAVESALSQTHQPCEVLVVDDGSTDNSLEILQNYASRIRILAGPHQGETASRNLGFAHSSGELVCFLDADDVLLSNAAGQIVESWRPAYTKVQYQMRVIDRGGVDQNLLMPRCPLDSGTVYPLILATGRYISAPGSGNFYARSFLEKIMPAPAAEWPQSFDTYASTYAAFLGEIGVIRQPLASYRVHPKNMSGVLASHRLSSEQIDNLLERQLRLRRLIRRVAADRGMQPSPDIVVSHWLYLKLELAKRSYDPACSLRELASLVARMTVSALSAPELSLARRFQLIFWAIGSAFLPAPISARVTEVGFDLAPENKWVRLMRRL